MKDFFWFLIGLVVCFFTMIVMIKPQVPPASAPVAAPAAQCAPQAAAPCTTAAPTKKYERYETVINGDPPATDEVAQPKKPDAAGVLSRLSLVELREVCGKAERSLLADNLDDYAPGPHDEDESKIWLNELFEQIRDSLHKKGSWWHGTTDLPVGKDKTMHLDFIFKLYGADEQEIRDPFTSNMPARISSADGICYSLRVYTTFEGKTSEAGAASICQNPGRKKGEAFFMKAALSETTSPAAATILVPFPVRPMPPLEFLIAGTKTWISKSDFIWEQSSVEEWQKIQDRYLKSASP